MKNLSHVKGPEKEGQCNPAFYPTRADYIEGAESIVGSSSDDVNALQEQVSTALNTASSAASVAITASNTSNSAIDLANTAVNAANAASDKADSAITLAHSLQESAVTGVKGSAENEYRTGDVDITAADIGLGNVNNTADNQKSVNYANTAGSATKAAQDSQGQDIAGTYIKELELVAGDQWNDQKLKYTKGNGTTGNLFNITGNSLKEIRVDNCTWGTFINSNHNGFAVWCSSSWSSGDFPDTVGTLMAFGGVASIWHPYIFICGSSYTTASNYPKIYVTVGAQVWVPIGNL